MTLIKSSLQRPSELPVQSICNIPDCSDFQCTCRNVWCKFKVTSTENVSLQYLHLLACFTAVNYRDLKPVVQRLIPFTKAFLLSLTKLSCVLSTDIPVLIMWLCTFALQ